MKRFNVGTIDDPDDFLEPDMFCPTCGVWFDPNTDHSHDGH